jgi:hypothetical protein
MIFYRFTIALVVEVLFILALQAPAIAGTCNIPARGHIKQNPDSPVQIQGYEATFTMNALSVAFMNTSPKTVIAVLWEVRIGNGAAFIRDSGTFSTGVMIRHCAMRYGLREGNFVWQEQPRILVARVKFADGSEWSIPGAPEWDEDF